MTDDAMHLAARLGFRSRAAWLEWLGSPAARSADVSDWGAMYRGWFFKTQAAVGFEPPEGTVRDALRGLQASPAVRAFWCRWDDAARECWLWSTVAAANDGALGGVHRHAERTFAQCRAATPHLADGVWLSMYWSSSSGEPEPGNVAAVCALGGHGAEFVDAGGMAEYGLDWQTAMHNAFGQLALWRRAAVEAGAGAVDDLRWLDLGERGRDSLS